VAGDVSQMVIVVVLVDDGPGDAVQLNDGFFQVGTACYGFFQQQLIAL
jgi:hypothetical protein